MKFNAVKAMIIASLIIIIFYILGLFLPIIMNSKNSKIHNLFEIENMPLHAKTEMTISLLM